MVDNNPSGKTRVTIEGQENEGSGDAAWSNFVRFTQQIVSVPKDEIDAQAKKHKEDKTKS